MLQQPCEPLPVSSAVEVVQPEHVEKQKDIQLDAISESDKTEEQPELPVRSKNKKKKSKAREEALKSNETCSKTVTTTKSVVISEATTSSTVQTKGHTTVTSSSQNNKTEDKEEKFNLVELERPESPIKLKPTNKIVLLYHSRGNQNETCLVTKNGFQ